MGSPATSATTRFDHGLRMLLLLLLLLLDLWMLRTRKMNLQRRLLPPDMPNRTVRCRSTFADALHFSVWDGRRKAIDLIQFDWPQQTTMHTPLILFTLPVRSKQSWSIAEKQRETTTSLHGY